MSLRILFVIGSCLAFLVGGLADKDAFVGLNTKYPHNNDVEPSLDREFIKQRRNLKEGHLVEEQATNAAGSKITPLTMLVWGACGVLLPVLSVTLLGFTCCRRKMSMEQQLNLPLRIDKKRRKFMYVTREDELRSMKSNSSLMSLNRDRQRLVQSAPPGAIASPIKRSKSTRSATDTDGYLEMNGDPEEETPVQRRNGDKGRKSRPVSAAAAFDLVSEGGLSPRPLSISLLFADKNPLDETTKTNPLFASGNENENENEQEPEAEGFPVDTNENAEENYDGFGLEREELELKSTDDQPEEFFGGFDEIENLPKDSVVDEDAGVNESGGIILNMSGIGGRESKVDETEIARSSMYGFEGMVQEDGLSEAESANDESYLDIKEGEEDGFANVAIDREDVRSPASPSILKRSPEKQILKREEDFTEDMDVSASEEDAQEVEKVVDGLNYLRDMEMAEAIEYLERMVDVLDKPGCIRECVDINGAVTLISAIKEFGDYDLQIPAFNSLRKLCTTTYGTSEVFNNNSANIFVFALEADEVWKNALYAMHAAIHSLPNDPHVGATLMGESILQPLSMRLTMARSTEIIAIFELLTLLCPYINNPMDFNPVLGSCKILVDRGQIIDGKIPKFLDMMKAFISGQELKAWKLAEEVGLRKAVQKQRDTSLLNSFEVLEPHERGALI
eukprot:m.31012 g.31012  ORF g.31012 m.31012 type:complete len:677 (-) comp8269_c0_seq1:58-2088(-)